MRRFTAALFTVLALFTLARVQATTPAGFEDTLVATVAGPTAIAFTPDGRLLITVQSGRLRVVQNGALLATSALDLSSSLCTNSERGLLGVAVDPAFTSNNYIYVYYTLNKSGVCEQNTARSPVNRVSRFVLPGTNVVDRASELVLIDNIPSPNGNHNGGDLHFGKDGYLYISIGDGGCDYAGNSGCAGANDASRDTNVLLGKVLRITRTGGIPAGNPFTGTGSARCNTTGRTTAGNQCQETYASGFRNPFRFAADPNAAGTRIFVNDVGQDRWEEVDLLRAGADYGWNVREGNCANGSTTNCGAPPAGLTNPIHAYGHSSGCASITGGAFVPAGIWPAAYDGAYIFGDYVCGTLFTLKQQTDGSYVESPFVTNLGTNSAVAMTFGPFGATQALYYTSYANGGQVRRIAYTGNRTPTAVATASPTAGAVPLSVRFDGSGSSDPDGDALRYDWNFQDGTAHATTAVVTHSYTTSGQFDAVLTVTDSKGASSTATVRINAGNTPPVPSITSPATSTKFRVGSTVTLRGTATDAEQGTLPSSALSWTVILHHNTHTHPFLGPAAGDGITFTAPAPEDLAATTTSYLEIRLTATDSAGASRTVTQRFDPQLVEITLATEPAGLTVSANETSLTGPTRVTSWAGYVLRLTAATQDDQSDQPWLPTGWSDGGAASHTVVTPSAATTYTASFAAATRAAPVADSFVRGGSFAATNFGTRDSVELKFSTNAYYVRETYLRFDLRNVATIGIGKVRLYGAITDTRSVNVPVTIQGVANTTWSETGLTWNNRPPSSTAVLSTATVPDAIPAWHEWDVTSYLRAEKAAGRNLVTLILRSAAASPPHLAFNSRENQANQPELLVAAETPGSASEVVLYASDSTVVAGAWQRVSDASAAGGIRVRHPNAGAAKLTTALASPVNYVEFTFDAEAGVPYRLWIRGRADSNSYANDSVFVQFSGSVNESGQPVYRIGTTGETTYVLEDCSGCGVSGWGWQDNGYGVGVLGPTIRFATSGPQTIRIQTREDGLSIDQVILSSSRYLNSAPGAPRNDSTIVPK
ncbi:MAG TPA: PQQ-dependent sugar dehydrogenase [Vicinamibacterales bacterium]